MEYLIQPAFGRMLNLFETSSTGSCDGFRCGSFCDVRCNNVCGSRCLQVFPVTDCPGLNTLAEVSPNCNSLKNAMPVDNIAI
ncbi:MAG: hypothetical protein FWG64_03435 [Firmicutes bacterium]|nr:hypothetical protein [Bacillota bacterium]